MNAKVSVFAICVKANIYLLLYHLHDCTFKQLTKSCSTSIIENNNTLASPIEFVNVFYKNIRNIVVIPMKTLLNKAFRLPYHINANAI